MHADRGMVSVVELPDAAHVASYTTAVAAVKPASKAVAIPARVGNPPVIEHVVNIIAANRT